MKNHRTFLLCCAMIFGTVVCAQTVSGCDFFPNRDLVKFTYIRNSFSDNKSKSEFKYVYKGNVVIEGKTYKAYSVFVNGAVPETNQVLYVNCDSNNLILGNGIYAFNRQIIGYSQRINKIVDINATPIFEVGMVHTGDFYLPSVIKPNIEKGDTWDETNYMHGNQVIVKNTLIDKNQNLEVQGKIYKNVYHIKKETIIKDVVFVGDVTTQREIYFAKGIGMIKTVEFNDLGNIITELDGGLLDKEREVILQEIRDIINKLPADPDIDATYQDLAEKRDDLSIEQLKVIRDGIEQSFKQYQIHVNDSIKRQNKKSRETTQKINEFGEVESNLKREGLIDQRLLGTWKLVSTGKSFYKFYEDGTLEIYKGSIGKSEKASQKSMFRVTNGNMLERLYELYKTDDFGHQKHHIDFDVDRKTGKPLIHLKLVYLNSVESRPQHERNLYYNDKTITYIKID